MVSPWGRFCLVPKKLIETLLRQRATGGGREGRGGARRYSSLRKLIEPSGAAGRVTAAACPTQTFLHPSVSRREARRDTSLPSPMTRPAPHSAPPRLAALRPRRPRFFYSSSSTGPPVPCVPVKGFPGLKLSQDGSCILTFLSCQ